MKIKANVSPNYFAVERLISKRTSHGTVSSQFACHGLQCLSMFVKFDYYNLQVHYMVKWKECSGF